MRTAAALVVALALIACDDTSGNDAGVDAEVRVDAGSDAGSDAGMGSDAGTDSGSDASVGCTPACGDCEACVSGVCRSVGGPHALTQLTSGWYHLLGIDPAGVLYVWGENDNGQLGLGDAIDRDVATPLPGAWIAADGGSRHTCAVRADGTLWCMGANVHGQLGTGDVMDRDVPTQVAADAARDLDNPWVDIACGGLHSCALKMDGSIWCFGSAIRGQLGLGTPSGDVWAPARVGGATPDAWASVAAQTRHTCAIREADRGLYCWGDDSNGQLGQADLRDDVHNPIQVMGTSSVRYASVRNGALHTCVIDEAGALDCFGANSFGQLGVGDTADHGTLQRVGSGYAEVASGFEHTCAVTASGELSCWGNGMMDQLGLDDRGRFSTPQRVGAGSDWQHVVAGYYHSCAINTAGETFCWGDHVRGQQGGGPDVGTHRPTPGRVCFAAP